MAEQENVSMYKGMIKNYFPEYYLSEGKKYFYCGGRDANSQNAIFYNFNLYRAISVIGKMYGTGSSRKSNYKKVFGI